MKKTVRVLALVMVALMLCLALTSCAKTIKGKYKAEINVLLASYEVVYEFKGKNVTVTRQLKSVVGNVDPVEIKGTYAIEETAGGDLEITFTFEGEDDEIVKGGTFDFEEGDGYIKIGVAKYTAVE